jgi:hypothetical protein
MGDPCPEFIRTDCTRWFGEIEASQPTVVFEVKDARGTETNAVTVSLDGKPWLEKLDGTAKPIDPGHHTLAVAIENGPPVERSVEAAEGEKNHLIRFSFEPAAASNANATEKTPRPSVLPWVAGGLGLAGLALFGVAGAVTLGKKSVTDADCNSTAKTCTGAGLSAANSGKTFGALATTGVVVGVAGVGVSVVLFTTRRKEAPPATVGVRTWTNTAGGGFRFEGDF